MHYASIRSMDISNGEGVGVALFVQGCHFQCYNCFNQETWDFDGGAEWTKDIKNEFLNLVDRPYITRVSFLGGEPLANENVETVLEIIKEIRTKCPGKTVWLYTGYEWERIWKTIYVNKCGQQYFPIEADLRREVLRNIDVLVDGQYIDDQKDMSLKWKGSSNQRVIDVQQSILKEEIILWKK